ncbi:MAG: thioredoxin-dependent thiol peroxidase [Acidimicrobiia bacterium]
MMELEAGQDAPGFRAPDQTGTIRTSDEFEGSKLVIYFYPRAFTPGCTTESCDFRDSHEHLAARGYTILGVSPDKPQKLKKFKDEYELPFDLLSDPDHTIAAAYGAYGTKKNYGKEYKGIIRSTFIIDEDGRVTEPFYNIRAKGHVDRLVQSIDT